MRLNAAPAAAPQGPADFPKREVAIPIPCEAPCNPPPIIPAISESPEPTPRFSNTPPKKSAALASASNFPITPCIAADWSEYAAFNSFSAASICSLGAPLFLSEFSLFLASLIVLNESTNALNGLRSVSSPRNLRNASTSSLVSSIDNPCFLANSSTLEIISSSVAVDTRSRSSKIRTQSLLSLNWSKRTEDFSFSARLLTSFIRLSVLSLPMLPLLFSNSEIAFCRLRSISSILAE